MRTRIQALTLFTFLLAASPVIAQPPYLSWAGAIGSTLTDRSTSLVVDGGDNMIVGGYFQGTADFDPAAGTTTLVDAGSNDGFVAKYGPTGNLLWARSFSSSSEVKVNSVAVDGAGNIYATGYFFGTVDMDPEAGVTNFTSAGNEDIFIVKLTSSGSLMWAKQIGSTSNDMAVAIHVDGFGNLYTTGTYRGTV